MVFFVGSHLVFSQDLVKAAQKEKARRAKLKKKSTLVVTNANLSKPDKEAALKSSPPENQAIAGQGVTPLTSQQTAPARSTPSQKKLPPLRVKNIDRGDPRADRADQRDQQDGRSFGSTFASRVLSSNELVRNPELALDKPDGRFAELDMQGIIDLEISIKNGPGDDIAVYALHAGAQSVASGGEEEGGIPQIVTDYYGEGLWYGVLAMGEQGEWIALGKGSGTKSPEKFDLGDLTSIKQVRITFTKPGNPSYPVKFNRTQGSESAFKIDAVESLHK